MVLGLVFHASDVNWFVSTPWYARGSGEKADAGEVLEEYEAIIGEN
jgi:hypothetical protein